MTLRARIERLDADDDPFDVAGPDGFAWRRPDGWMAGRGTARRITVEAGVSPADAAAVVADALASVEVDAPAGAPPLRALATIPFRPGAAFDAVIPAHLEVHDRGGARWSISVADGSDPVGHGPIDDGIDSAHPSGASRFEVAPSIAPEVWMDHVGDAVKRLVDGEATKVVLAREVVVTADAPLDATAVARRLAATFPSCTVLSIDGLVAATPELLVSRHGDVVRSHPLAGTAPRSADAGADARLAASLLASAKDRAEHQITIDRVHETLLPFCSWLDSEAEPSIVAVANVQHLGTMVEGRLSDPPPSVLELALLLHPTPAVCGEPRDAALAMIDAIEPTDRDRYAGAAGWVDATGDGEWVVSIRCGEIDGATARVWAGGGILADSDPATELAETQAKFGAVLGALIRP